MIRIDDVPLTEYVWRVGTVDQVVLWLPVGLLAIVALNLLPSKWLRHELQVISVAVGVFLATYIGYATLRNQMRVAVEASLNEEGMAIYSMEMNDPNLRCLYSTNGYGDPSACLASNVMTPETWSKAIWYVEGTLILLERVQQARSDWASRHEQTTAFWAESISEDPTGMFSYYALSMEGIDGARARLSDAGVCIPDLCAGYLRVRYALPSEGRDALQPSLCQTPSDIHRARMTCQHPS